VRLRLGPGLVSRHAREVPGQPLADTRIDDLADGQVIDDHGRGQRPVTGPGRMPDRVGQFPVPLVPPGRPAMQRSHPIRVLVA